MSLLIRIWRSSLGKKYIMAVSGCILFLFIVMHMLGNMLIFLGPEHLNQYGNFLQTTPEVIWPMRLMLMLMVILHFTSAAQLTLENRSSRPIPYSHYDVVAASYAARTMIWSGFIVLFFVIYHLLHFTIQSPEVNLTGQDFRAFSVEGAKRLHDVYRMMVVGFQQHWVSLFYIVAVGLLCIHLSHGISSMFQSMGWRNTFYRKYLDRFAVVAAILIFLGYCSIPVAVLLGMVKVQ